MAAVGDLHMRPPLSGRFRAALQSLQGRADLLLLAGDLTNGGTLEEVEVLRCELADLPLPVVAVLGNHDHDECNGAAITEMARGAGVRVLDGESLVIDVAGMRVGLAGVMGGGGGFGEDLRPEDEDRPGVTDRRRQAPRRPVAR